jgi:hypothetical protein
MNNFQSSSTHQTGVPQSVRKRLVTIQRAPLAQTQQSQQQLPQTSTQRGFGFTTGNSATLQTANRVFETLQALSVPLAGTSKKFSAPLLPFSKSHLSGKQLPHEQQQQPQQQPQQKDSEIQVPVFTSLPILTRGGLKVFAQRAPTRHHTGDVYHPSIFTYG